MKPVPKAILETIRKNQSFLIVVHDKPDGDAIGSAIAFGKGLKTIGKDVDYHIQVPVEEKLQFFSEKRFFDDGVKAHYDVMVYLDSSTEEYAYKPEGVTADIRLVIDHHLSNQSYGDVNFVEIAGATGELVYRVLKALGAEFDDEMVEAVFTGISTDTGSFQFSNVTADTHQVLSELYTMKNNFAPLSKKLHSEKTYAQIKLYGKAIESMRLYYDNTLAWIQLDYADINKYGGPLNITDDVANIGMNTIGVQLSATIKEVDNGIYRVSLRSKSPFNIDVSRVAKHYNGGGHMRAAGFGYEGDLKDLRKELMVFLEESLTNEDS